MATAGALWVSWALLALSGAAGAEPDCRGLTAAGPAAAGPAAARLPDLASPAFDSSAQDLALSYCDITALPAGWLGVARHLRNLDLRGNLIESIGAGAFSGPLTEIDLSSNERNLTIGSGAFGGLPELRRLVLGDCKIVSIAPDFIGDSASLRELVLKQSNLRELPGGAFAGLGALRKLDLSGNYLATLPADAFLSLAALRELTLYNNDLAALTAGVFRPLAALRSLSLRSNYIEVVPDYIFAGLTELRSVDLGVNRVHTVAPNAFRGVDLHTLDLGQNRLTLGAAERSPFHPLRNLQRLLLMHNSFSRLARDWTAEMASLRELELVSNNFTELHVSASEFGERDRDLWVDLTSNRIASPTLDDDESGAPDPDDPIVHLTLAANPLVCDCALKHAARCGWNPHERRCGVRFEMGDANCAAPPGLKGYWPSNAFKRLQCPARAA